MSATGIGARVRAQGRPALHHRQGPLRRRHQPCRARPTPISCARRTPMPTITSIDTPRPRRRCRACVAIFTGDDLAADKVGGLICGWMIHSKDGSPMKAGAASGAGARARCAMSATMSPSSSPRRWRRRKDAAEPIAVDYEVLPAVVDTAEAPGAGAPQVHDVAPDNTVFDWHLGDKAATDAAFARRPSTSPSSTSSTTA